MTLTIGSTYIEDKDYWEIKPVGEVDIANAAKLRAALHDSYEKTPANVRLDASDLRYIDSTGLGVIIGAYGRMQENGHAIHIESPKVNVRKLLQVTSLDKIFCPQ
ncbi:MAG: STAS domain-containing protein [Clostridiales Family XIII bacterium]|jgi:anti-sigma B factor antagonist|nr:STAS domain-containing protein [Clostridiales Family XIII bacterium]